MKSTPIAIPDPFETVLTAVRDAPPSFIKAIADQLEPLRTKAFLTPDAAWAMIGFALKEYMPDLVKSYPTLIWELSERVPGPGVRFEVAPLVPGERALRLVRMVRGE